MMNNHSTFAIDHHHITTTVLTMNSIRPSFICAACARSIRSRTTPTSTIRTISQSAALQQQEVFEDATRDELPRWQKTPPRMRMPIRMRPIPDQPRWSVNTKQEVVDHAFDNFVGGAGDGVKGSEMLDSETKVRF
jgi:large subunit ribosomal protein L15